MRQRLQQPGSLVHAALEALAGTGNREPGMSEHEALNGTDRHHRPPHLTNLDVVLALEPCIRHFIPSSV